MNAGEKNFASRALALLRQGPFRRYIIGSAISDTGTWMQVMAQGWVHELAHRSGAYARPGAVCGRHPDARLDHDRRRRPPIVTTNARS